MATYLTGQPLFLPSVQPYQPNFQLYTGALQMKQTQYDANRKKISNLYGSLLNAPLTRDNNVQARDEFFNTIDYEIQKLSGVDLSLEENVNSAARLFTSLYDNKNIVKDMVWTKNFQNEMSAAESFRNCVDPEKCGGQYWDGGVQALEYKRQEFRNASDEQAMGFGDVKYTPYVNVQERAAKIFKEMGWNYKPMPTIDGAWIIQEKNGQPIVGPLAAHLQAVLGQDPQIQDYYKTKAYLDRKSWVYNNAEQFGGDLNAAEAEYISTAQKSINSMFSRLNQEAKHESKTAKYKAEDIEKGVKEGYIEDTDDTKSEIDRFFGQAEQFDKYDETTSSILTSTAGTTKADLRASGEVIDANMAQLFLNSDLETAAQILAFTDYEVDVKVNDVWKMEKEHQNRLSEIAYKQRLEDEAAKEAAMGPPELNELYAGLMSVQPVIKDDAAFKQMRGFAAENAKSAKLNNTAVLERVIKEAQGSANAGGLNATQAGEDARLIVERVLKQYKGNSDYNGSAEAKKYSSAMLNSWNSKSKAEQIAWAKTFDVNKIIDKMDYGSIHNIIETSLGTKGGNFLEDNKYNRTNRAYLNLAKSQLGDVIAEAENQYKEAKAWRETLVNAHNTVSNDLDATGPKEMQGKWKYLYDPVTGAARSLNNYAWAYAKDNTLSAGNSPAEKLERAKNDQRYVAQLADDRAIATSIWNEMSPERKAQYNNNKERYVRQYQASKLPNEESTVQVPLGNNKYKYIKASEFFTPNGSVKSKYAAFADKWKPGNSSEFWTKYNEAKKAYTGVGSFDDEQGFWSKTGDVLEFAGNVAVTPLRAIEAAIIGDASILNPMQSVRENNALNYQNTVNEKLKAAEKKTSEMEQIYRKQYNISKIMAGKQSYLGLKGGGSLVSEGVSQFVDYGFHQSAAVLRERDFLQNALQARLGMDTKIQFGANGTKSVSADTDPEALRALQFLIGQAIMGKKESRPTWVGEFNPLGAGNDKWQAYTITVNNPQTLKALAYGGEDQILFEELQKNNGRITVYLKDAAANNEFHNRTKKSGLERRMDYDGSAPIAAGQFPTDFHSLRLTPNPNGYNVSGNIGVGYDENGQMLYDYYNKDYYGSAEDPNDINAKNTFVLNSIYTALGKKPYSAFPSYVGN